MILTDIYFTRSKEAAIHAGLNPRVRYNVFMRKAGIFCGNKQARLLLKTINNMKHGARIWSLDDGDPFMPNEPIMRIEGYFQDLVELETELLGYLTLCGPATRMHQLVEAADGVPVIDMCARHYYPNASLGYAAFVGGAKGTSTMSGWRSAIGSVDNLSDGSVSEQEFADKWDFHVFGSIPHALNAVTGGSIPAAKVYQEKYPDLPLTVLTDYEGMEMDVIREAVETFGDKLYAVRLDTHGGRIHQGGSRHYNDFVKKLSARRYKKIKEVVRDERIDDLGAYYGKGVTVEAYLETRELLDALGATNVKIVLSSGFNEEKIKAFRPFIDSERTAIGTGSWVGSQDYHATMDIVAVESEKDKGVWRNALKKGREYTSSNRLKEWKL